jgi:hypothetical protein
MQDLDAPSGYSIGVPKIGIPIKWIAGFIAVLILIGAGWLAVRSSQQPPYDDSAIWTAILAVNNTITSRQYIDSNLNNLDSRMTQLTTQLTGIKTDITSIKNDVKNLKLNSTNNINYSSRLTDIENRLGKVETNMTRLGNLNWIAGFPIANNSTPVKYLCEVTGVPAELKFQYTFQCICDLRKTYGPYLNAGAACAMNRDARACTCYQTICDSKEGLC